MMTLAERIERAVVINHNGCWLWQRRRDREGYGRLRSNERDWLAHRAAYTAFVGEIPQGLTIDHLCRNPSCVNPAHLEAVTMRENNLRGDSPSAKAARQTHCLRGHPYSEANTWRDKNGVRYCRACSRYRYRARRQRGSN